MKTTSNVSHTPGPWTVDGLSVNYRKYKPLAMMDTEYLADCSDNPCRSVLSSIPEKEAYANARLIAAAPELLSRVKSLLAYMQAKGEQPEYVKETLTIIAKAEGR